MPKKKVKIQKKKVSLSLGQKIGKTLLNYITTQFILMVLVGVASWGILSLLNVRYAILLGVLAGVSSGIPNFGMIVTTVAATLVAFFDKVNIWNGSSPWLEAFLVLIIFVLLNKFVDLILAPIFLGKTNKINPFIMFLLVLLGTIFFGVWGAVLAVPVFLVVKTIIEHFNS